MKKNLNNKWKKGMAAVMMACMLLTVAEVNSNTGIMQCWLAEGFVAVL